MIPIILSYEIDFTEATSFQLCLFPTSGARSALYKPSGFYIINEWTEGESLCLDMLPTCLLTIKAIGILTGPKGLLV